MLDVLKRLFSQVRKCIVTITQSSQHEVSLAEFFRTDLHEVLCKLAVALPELVEGKVHAAVVDQVPGDGQRVSLRSAVLLQALAEDDHDALPVAARHLKLHSQQRNRSTRCYKCDKMYNTG